jgi:hypothetical protein
METITHNPRHAIRWDIGRNLYIQGINSYQAVYKGIRALGYYLMCGDADIGLSSVKDDEERANIILSRLTKTLFWSKEKFLELKESVLSACRWRPPNWMNMTKKISKIDVGRRDVRRYEKKIIEEERLDILSEHYSEEEIRTSPIANIDSSSTNSSRNSFRSNTIYNYSKPEKRCKEPEPPLKEDKRLEKAEIYDIFKTVLGDKFQTYKQNGMLRALRL